MITNPLFEGADPFLLLHNGTYYLYYTTETPDGSQEHSREEQSKGICVYSSEDLCTWTHHGFCLRREDVMGEKWFWAPEVTYYQGKFYMVYTAEEHLGIAVADSPLGPFTQEDKQWLSQRRAIDGSFFFDDDGTPYLFYVRLKDKTNGLTGNTIFGARLSQDLMTLDEESEVLLICAQDPWEVQDSHVTEGPFVLKRNGVYHLSYSANHTRSHDYAVGCAVASTPLGVYKKYPQNPILKKTETIVGLGHHSFSQTKDGGKLICAYHRHTSTEQFHPRMVCLDYAEFIATPEGDVLTIHGPTEKGAV